MGTVKKGSRFLAESAFCVSSHMYILRHSVLTVRAPLSSCHMEEKPGWTRSLGSVGQGTGPNGAASVIGTRDPFYWLGGGKIKKKKRSLTSFLKKLVI